MQTSCSVPFWRKTIRRDDALNVVSFLSLGVGVGSKTRCELWHAILTSLKALRFCYKLFAFSSFGMPCFIEISRIRKEIFSLLAEAFQIQTFTSPK